MHDEITKARKRLQYHRQVLKGKVNAPRLTLAQKEANVKEAEAALAALQPAKLPNRETWLNAFIAKARPVFHQAGYVLPPNIKISIGFPSHGGLSARKLTLGECWKGQAEGEFHVFVSPLIDDTKKAAGITTHELAHTAAGMNHRKPFAKCCAAIGLEGKPASNEPGTLWDKFFAPILEELGPIPHHKLVPADKDKKKQTTRMLKCECPVCGFTFRTTAKWLEDKRVLKCPDVDCDGFIDLD